MRPKLRVIPGPPSDARQRDAQGDDRALAKAVARGERAAIAELTRRCLPVVYSIARRLINEGAEAEDLAQETFVKVWRAIDRYDAERARLETWVARIATNVCLDRLRKRREATLGEDVPEPPDPAARADALLEAGGSADRVRQAVGRLPERQRLALELCSFQDHTNIEVANILGVSVEAVESLLARARRTLKQELLDESRDLIDCLAGAHGGES
ncbi:sigma-70 family RNA polymerase sigma factor [Maricaulaceae bacterium NA33B04]|nr:sigma-70 family RNA polymerase sigma factor [Maricaulaceae bacterium NA33B04]